MSWRGFAWAVFKAIILTVVTLGVLFLPMVLRLAIRCRFFRPAEDTAATRLLNGSPARI